AVFCGIESWFNLIHWVMEPYAGNGGCFGGRLLPSPSKRKLMLNLGVVQQRSGKKYPVKSSDYKLLEEVGVGSTAIVYRALCVPFQEIVAVKIVGLDKSSATLDRLCHEVKTMALINHPNVLRAHCSFVVDYNLWIVMPYIAWGSCLQLMKAIYHEGFKESVIASFLWDVLKALYYLHTRGQVHRNVKAGNILVDASGAVILGGFGFSTSTFDNGDTQCSSNTFVGTSYWMAPEVMEPHHSSGPKVDIWSFGITALELSQGHDSFNKYSPMKVLQTASQRPNLGNNYERQNKLSKPFLEIITKCLTKDPTKRPSAKKLLKHSFFKNAPYSDAVVQTVFNGLPHLGDMLKALKLREASILEQKKLPSEEREDQSQSKHKQLQGISLWNFDLEDIEVQASSIQDDEEMHSTKAMENQKPIKETESVVKIESIRPESGGEGGDHILQVQSSSLEASVPLQSPNGLKEHVDVFEGNNNPYSIPEMECIKFKDQKLVVFQAQKDDASKAQDYRHALEKAGGLQEDSHNVYVQSHDVCSSPLAGDKSNEHQHQPKFEQDSSGSSSFHRMNVTHSADCIYKRTNAAGNRDNSGEMTMVPAVQEKGRFKVTSENLDPEQTMPQPTTVPFSTSSTSNLAISTIRPLIQNISDYNATQGEKIVNLIKLLSQGKISSVHLSNLGSKASSCNGLDNLRLETSSEREQELLQKVVELQIRVANITHEIQKGKTMNIQ
ncbi:hypothetical protein KI387_001038, partial [Taxus chinensis]